MVVDSGVGNNTGNPLNQVGAASGEFAGKQVHAGVLQRIFSVVVVAADAVGDGAVEASVGVESVEQVAVGREHVVRQETLFDRAKHGRS